MNENKNSLLGITEQNTNLSVNAVPFSVSLPEENTNQTPTNFVSINTPQVSETQTKEQKTPEQPTTQVNAVQMPPPLLQKSEEPAKEEVPFLLKRTEEPAKEEVPFLLKRPEPDTTAVPTIPRLKEENKPSPENTTNVFGEMDSNNIVSQKIKVASTLTETTNKLSENEKKLKLIQEQVETKKEEIKQKNMASESYMALKPAFENIQNVLDFQRENSKSRDYDDQHYTVPQTQSLFDKTVNQLTDLPYWRGK